MLRQAMTDTPFLLEARALCKEYGELKANDNVSLCLRAGSIHALIGENGAGKSTLVSILCGATHPDSGALYWRGNRVIIRNPAMARQLGIGVVFQHFALVDELSVGENIALGVGKSVTQMMRPLGEIAERYGLSTDPQRQVGELSAGEKQRVEILRCLLQSPQLLILDEPTSVLTPSEAEKLFVLLRTLATEGCGILFISHKLDEVCSLCDNASVLRQGRMIAADIHPQKVGRDKLIDLMLGGARVLPPSVGKATVKEGKPESVVMEVRDLRLPSAKPRPLLVKHLALRAGVITGVAGISGNGQDALLDCLSGEQRLSPQMVLLEGAPVGDWNCHKRATHGILAVPTERHGRAAIGELSLSENGLLGMSDSGGKISDSGFLHPSIMRQFAADIIQKFSVRADSPDSAASALSGGNLQKFIIGRTLAQRPRVLLAANPTWGVDVQSAAFIRNAISQLRGGGAAVLVLSEDLDELLELCDEIAVINGGVLSQPIPCAQASIAAIGDLMVSGSGLEGGTADNLTNTAVGA